MKEFTEHLIDSLNNHFLQVLFIDRPGMADVAGGLQPAAASPDDGFAATVVPVNAPEEFTAFTAENHLGKTVIAGVAAPFTILSGMHKPSSCKLLLHQKEDVLRNDRFVVALHVVLRDSAVVLDALLRQEVRGVGLLEKGVTDVFLVSENLIDGAGVPLRLACTGENAVRFKTSGNLVHAFAFEVFPVNPLDDFCLLWIDDQVAVSVLGVSEERSVQIALRQMNRA